MGIVNTVRWSRTARTALALGLLVAAAGCRPGAPVVDPSPKPPTRDGTISGRVVGPAGSPLGARTLEFTNVATGRTHGVSSDPHGAFTIKVPPGKYTLKVELRPGEQLAKSPAQIEINESDLDNNIEIVIRQG